LTLVEDAPDNVEAVRAFAAAPRNFETEPPLKLLLLRSGGKDTLCVKLDHVVSDAGGLKCLLHLLAEAYTNGKISSPINQRRDVRQILRAFPPFKVLRELAGSKLPVPKTGLAEGPFETGTTFIEHLSIEPHTFETIKAKAKKEAATVNDLILAALFRAIFKNIPPDCNAPYPVMVPADMRRYLPDDKKCVIANLASAVYPALKRVEGEAFDDTLARVRQLMGGFKNGSLGLGTMALMTLGSLFGGAAIKRKYRAASVRGSRFINLTNFGVFDDSRLVFGSVHLNSLYGIGPLQFPPGILIAVSTFSGTLNLVVQSNDAQRFQPIVRGLLEQITAELKNNI
jgi:NRPS condensation-like uncharacterized protein